MNMKPFVSICMPVYNGETFIGQALDSLLAQDYENFELIISDNASIDKTQDICHEYMAKDRRIKYYRNETNLGAAKNFNKAFGLSSGKYFMFAGDHELWHPTYISQCISILENEPDVVLVYSRTKLIDAKGNILEILPDKIDTRGMSTVNRYKCIIWNLSWCNMVYGVIRRYAYSQTSGFMNILGPDNVLLAELSLKGTYAQIDEPLYYRRQNRPTESGRELIKNRMIRIDPANINKRRKQFIIYLFLEEHVEYLKTLANSSIRISEKFELLGSLILKIILDYISILIFLVQDACYRFISKIQQSVQEDFRQ